jgi:two-component system chemotaxis response regulator CheB
MTMPYCGLADRMNTEQAKMRAEDFMRYGDEVVDIARGLGDHVTMAGISGGGLVTAWVAQQREDVDLAVPISPGLGIKAIPRFWTPFMSWALRVLPNWYIWEDPEKKENAPRLYNYVRIPSKVVGQILRLGQAIKALARQEAPAAGSIVVITNLNDPDIDNVAVDKVTKLGPDAVTMDIEMPNMNGIEAVRAIRKTQPRLPIVMFSTLTERGGSATLDALAAGASDYVTKPSNTGSFEQSKANIREQLIPKLKALTGTRRAVGGGTALPRSVPASRPVSLKPRTGAIHSLVIGCSTGGPDALAQVLPRLPGKLGVPVIVVQHMPPLFTRLIAQRLDSSCQLRVSEAVEGDLVQPGRVLIAPGGKHLTVRRQGTTVQVHLTEDPPENFCRPAVDVLFRSAASLYGDRLLAVVLTGMGRDGEKGATLIRSAGGEVYVQDEPTSVVWGMPGAVAMAGQADKILPLSRIGPEIAATLTRGPTPVGVAL